MCAHVYVCVQEYFQTIIEFLKLEKIEIGGSKGGILSELVVQIFTEFTELMNKFTNSTYDPLDVHNTVRWMFL